MMSPLPLGEFIDVGLKWLLAHFSGVFSATTYVVSSLDDELRLVLRAIPPWVTIIVVAAYVAWRQGYRAGIWVAACATLIWNLGLWRQANDTVSLVILATSASLAFGIPLGILCAENRTVRAIATPVLDFMQTTPAFVYLIPSVIFFGIGTTPGLLATMMFALPPAARATQLGITQVDPQINEAGIAYGSNRFQMLFKIKIPLARPFIALGVNQCIMMSLNVVVIAALIGARGLGTEVVTALTQLDLSRGIEAGVAIVLTAVILDRATATRPDHLSPSYKKRVAK